ncbi:MAG TPA: hypothetical protein GXZ24_06990 [Firmicutes bacterium]|nr:hypothetical protein [Bacillota bacterium]
MSGRKVTFQKLILEGFGPYREATEFIFSESINSFVAENESGKTTMSAGLIAVLFGLSHRQKTNTPFNLGNFRNWENPARCYGEIYFIAGSKYYQVARDFDTHRVELWSLGEDFTRKELLVEGQHNPDATKRLKKYEEKIRELLGLDSQGLFSDTFYVGQPLPEPDKISDELQGLLSGGKGTSFHLSLKRLQDNLKELTRFTGPNDRGVTPRNMGKDGLLEQMEEQIVQLAQQLEEGRLIADSLEETRKQLVSMDENYSKQKDELAKKERTRQAWSNWKLLQSEYRNAAIRRDKLKKAEKEAGALKEKIALLEGELEQKYPEFTGAPQDTAKMLEDLVWLDKQLQELDGAIHNLETSLQKNNASITELRDRIGKQYSGWEQLGADALAGLKIRRRYVETCQREWQQLEQGLADLKVINDELESTFMPFENASQEDLELIASYDRYNAKFSNTVEITEARWNSIKKQKNEFREAKSSFETRYIEIEKLPGNAGEIVSGKIAAMKEKGQLEEQEKRLSHKLVVPVWLRYSAMLLAAGLMGILVGTGNITITVLAVVAAALAAHWAATSIYNLIFSAKSRELARTQEKLQQCEEKIIALDNKLGSFANADEVELGRLIQLLDQYVEDKDRLTRDERNIPDDKQETIKREWEKAREEKELFGRSVAPFIKAFDDPPAAFDRWQSLKEEKGRLETSLDNLARETWGCDAETAATILPLSEGVAEHWQEAARFLLFAANPSKEQNMANLAEQLNALTETWWQQQEVITTQFAEIRNDIGDLEYELASDGKQLEAKRLKRRDIQNQKELVDEGIRQIVGANKNDAALALERWKNRQQVNGEIEVISRQLETLLDNNDVETIDQLQGTLSQMEDNVTTALLRWKEQIDQNPGLPGTDQADDLEQINNYLERIEKEIDQLDDKKNGLEQSRHTLMGKLATLEGQTPLNIAAAEIELAELTLQKGRLEIEADALEMAYKEMVASINEYRQTYRERLQKLTTDYCQAVSGMPHRHVELDENFNISIREGGRPCSLEQLSKGARDQLYLSLRFAVADLLAEEVKLPFIFDDSFTSTDTHRCENIRQILQQRAGERQFIILAHSDAYSAWGTPIKLGSAEC